MPPAPELGRVVADWQPTRASSVVGLGAGAVFGVVSLALGLAGLFAYLTVTLPLALLASLAWLEVRRSYMAVGDDWLYIRTRLLAGGAWTPFPSLESGKVTGKGGTTLLLRGRSFRGRVPVRDASMRRPTTFHGELARRLLARHLDLSPRARFVLHAWATGANADEARR
jgi:hypothetical protein